MPIDTSILRGIQPVQVENPLNRMAQVLQIKGLQQDQALGAMKADEYKRGIADTNAVNEAYRSAMGADGTVDRNRLFQTLAAGGQGSKIPAVQKALADTDKAQSEVFKAAGERYKLFQTTLGSQFNNPNLTKDSVLQTVGGLVQSGAFDPAVAQRLVSSLPDDPQQLRAHLRNVISTQMTPEQMLTAFAPKPQQVDNGQQIGFVDNNPNSPTYGKLTGASPIQKVATPGDVLSAQTSTANNQRSVAASRENAAATREVASATRDAARIQQNQNTEMKLADDYRAQSKSFKEVSDAYKTISTSLKSATTSPAATLAGATKFMKLLDPGSVVRESELGMALAATGVFDRAANYVNTLQRGKVLTPSQAADFENIAGQIFQAAAQQQKLIDTNYTNVAKQYGLRPEVIVQDLGQNAPARPVDLGTLPTGGQPKAGAPRELQWGK